MVPAQDENGFLRLFAKVCYYPALSLVVYLIGRTMFQQLISYRRLKHIPGPFCAAFTNLWILQTILKGYAWIEWGHICEKLGPVIRVGPNELLISDPESIRRILSVRSSYTRSDLFDSTRFNPSQNNLLSQREDRIHNEIRSKMIAGYSGKENDMLEATIDKNVQNMVKLITDKYISTSTDFRPMDLAQKVGYFTIDVISELAFGQAFGNLTQDKDMHGFFQAFDAMMPALTVLSIYPEFCKIMRANWVMKYILPSEKDPAGFGKIIGLAKTVVAERYGPNKKEQRDMLGSFVRHGLTQERAESEVLLQLGAGSDTVATAIRSTFLHIISSPAVYVTLKSEINNAAKNHLVSSPIQDFEAKTMSYLQACIKEGLRMWPPDAGASYRLSPPGGDTICGKFIPGADISNEGDGDP
ncbi:hypothetical protein B7494_g5034 [Chlorociboria aeruginascens]|nr:hypothetical protein B7494_g5034 [Chlorociboria aeruginascens]